MRRSLRALYSDIVKYLIILHVKIALVLPSLTGIVDGLQSSSQDLDWATQEHLFSSDSAAPVWLYLCVSNRCPDEM